MSNDNPDLILSTPTSNHTAELSEIVLSETVRTRFVFEPTHVDNSKDKTKQLCGKLVFQKPKQVNGETRLTRRDIHAGEYIELALDTTETSNLSKGLARYTQLTSNRLTATRPVSYIPRVSNDTIVKALRTRPEIIALLSQQDIDVFGAAMRLRELQYVRDIIRDNLDNDNEHFWQSMFSSHSWILSQVFSLPYMLFEDQPYVGGKGIRGSHGKFPDFLYQNRITGNVAIIEIKTPKTRLVYDTSYRDGVYSIHQDISGAVSQLLNQRDTLYKQYYSLVGGAEDGDRFEALNFDSLLVVGNTAMLDSSGKTKSFELYRNELRHIRIVCFDELLQKINTMIQLMEADN